MATPVAVITYDTTPIVFADLPASVVMTTGSCTWGGHAAGTYQFYLLDKPPGSAASLLNPTTATCTLQDIDVPGNYRVFLVIKNSNNEYSFQTPTPVQSGSAPYAFTSPPASAFATIRVTTENLALQKVAYGERDWLEDGLWPIVDALDALQGEVNAFGGAAEPRTKYVMAQAGSADADGSPESPYNPTSAAGGYGGNPWAQAIAALEAMDISDAPESGRTIVALGGDYSTYAISIADADAPWRILCHGEVVVGGAVTYTVANAGHLHDPDFMIAPVGDGAFVASAVALNLGDPAAASTWGVRLKECYFASAAVSGALVAGALAYFERCTFGGAFNVPNLRLRDIRHSTFGGTLTCRDIFEAHQCTFASVTVTNAATGDNPGFYHCGWAAAPTFTGAAGSALFCPVTRARFVTVSGSYAGGADANDVLRVGDLRSDEPSFYVGTDTGSMTVFGSGGIDLTSDAGAILVTTATTFEVDAVEEVTIGTTGTNKDLTLQTTNGAIIVNAGNATNGDVDIDAANAVTASAAGTMTLETTGTNKALTLQTTNGAIVINAGDATNGDIDIDAADRVLVDAAAVISATAGNINQYSRLYMEDWSQAYLGVYDNTLYGEVYLTPGVVQITSESDGEPDGDGDIDLLADDQINIDAYQVLYLVGGTSRTNSGVFSSSGFYGVVIGGPKVRVGDASLEHTLTNVTFADDAGKVKGTKTGHLMEDGLWVRVSGTTNGNGTYRIERIDADTFYLMDPTDGTSYSPWASFTGADVTGTVTIGHYRSDTTTNYQTTTGSIMLDAEEDVFIAADGTANVAVVTGAGAVNISNNGTGKINIQADANDVDITASGAGNINLTATGDDITLTANVVGVTADTNVTGFLSAKAGATTSSTLFQVVTNIRAEATSQATAGTTAEVFDSVNLPAGFWNANGVTVKGTANFVLAATGNSKEIAMWIGGTGGTKMVSVTTTQNGGTVHLEFEFYTDDSSNTRCWYRASRQTAKAPSFEEDETSATFTLTNVLSLDVGAITATASGDVIFKGWRCWSVAD